MMLHTFLFLCLLHFFFASSFYFFVVIAPLGPLKIMAEVRKRKAPAEMLMLSKPSRGRSKHITPSKIPKRMVVSLSKKPNETEVVDDVGTIINPIDEILLS